MSGRLGGVIESSCMSYSDKADSDDHTMAATLVFLFSCRFWRWWTFLFLEFPGCRERVKQWEKGNAALIIAGDEESKQIYIYFPITFLLYFD